MRSIRYFVRFIIVPKRRHGGYTSSPAMRERDVFEENSTLQSGFLHQGEASFVRSHDVSRGWRAHAVRPYGFVRCRIVYRGFRREQAPALRDYA